MNPFDALSFLTGLGRPTESSKPSDVDSSDSSDGPLDQVKADLKMAEMFRHLSDAAPVGFQIPDSDWQNLDQIHRRILDAINSGDRSSFNAARAEYQRLALYFIGRANKPA